MKSLQKRNILFYSISLLILCLLFALLIFVYPSTSSSKTDTILKIIATEDTFVFDNNQWFTTKEEVIKNNDFDITHLKINSDDILVTKTYLSNELGVDVHKIFNFSSNILVSAGYIIPISDISELEKLRDELLQIFTQAFGEPVNTVSDNLIQDIFWDKQDNSRLTLSTFDHTDEAAQFPYSLQIILHSPKE
ncbi:MAG: hypothetical protein N4A50_08495 [Vallitalea sp.]|jgi:lipopolysaccharide export LptBFGC system permease protein LptF|nr:hypothetical protein [Vallitalea sp.]